MTKSFTLKVLTGNHLLNGDVIYLSSNGEWTRELRKALLIDDETVSRSVLENAERDPGKVVHPYLVDVVPDANGYPIPVHFREVFRSCGPSNYFHGKQAGH